MVKYDRKIQLYKPQVFPFGLVVKPMNPQLPRNLKDGKTVPSEWGLVIGQGLVRANPSVDLSDLKSSIHRCFLWRNVGESVNLVGTSGSPLELVFNDTPSSEKVCRVFGF